MSRIRAQIAAIKSHVPDLQVTNEALAEIGKWDAETIHEKTGISVRRLARENECASDLGVAAAEKLFDNGDCRPKDIDFLLFCTQTPDYLLPATACLIQDRLGLKRTCGALDFNLGCSGFVYGLALAKGIIETGAAENLLLITADTYTKLLHPSDFGVRAIFGDGAAATLIRGVDADYEAIGPFVFGTDGRGAKELMVPAGAMRMPVTEDTFMELEVEPGIFRSPRNLYMNGPEIFSFTLKTIPGLVNALLTKCEMSSADVDYFVFHQASRLVLDHLRKKMQIPDEKFSINLESCGNTVSSTIPMAMEASLEKGYLKQGFKVMLVGFGVGYSWGAAMVRFP
jgi:3-oxoacyl-[acyl-carrier-protein] synthase III